MVGKLLQNCRGWSKEDIEGLVGQLVKIEKDKDGWVAESVPMAVEITYTTPASVRKMIEAKGDGYGINNTPDGYLTVRGEMYAKGSRFFVVEGVVYEHPDTNPIKTKVDGILDS